MDAEFRKVLNKLVLGIRHLLEGYYDDRGVWHAGDLEQRLNQIGVWRDRPAKPMEELPQLSESDIKARRTVDAYINYREDTGVSQTEAVEEFIQESAYTWFNRLFALRCMEARGIINEVILQKDIYGGRSLQHNRLAIRHPELCAGEDDGLHAVLFQEFERRAHELPLLFNPESPAVALRPSVSAVKRLVLILSGREPVNGNYASDGTFMAPDAFGWAYQYWNAEEKDRVFERVRTEKAKIEGRDIIPVTCIYTEPYMVKFLVVNSLGAQWCCMHPESRLYEGWEYYVKDADRSPVEEKSVQEITFLDPACGSGHFLLEAFDLFYEMYREEGELIGPEKMCASILENNLFGIDIDERAVQISIAVLWMKAKERAPELDTSSLSGFHDHLVATNILLPRGRNHLEEFLIKHPEDRPLRSALVSIFEALENVHEIGSLLKIREPLDQAFEDLRTDHGIQTTLWSNGFTRLDSWRESVITQLQEHFSEEAVSSNFSQAFFGHSMKKGLRLIELLSSEYVIVATNPPYMGSRNMGNALKKYVSENYQLGKRDLYGSFILLCNYLVKTNGRVAMVTQQSWMFLTSYTKLRARKIKNNMFGLLKETTIDSIVHLGTKAFNEISGEIVNIVLFILTNNQVSIDHRIKSFRVTGSKSSYDKDILLKNLIKKQEDDLIFNPKQISFLNIPEYPLCYWLNDKLLKILSKNTIKDYAKVVQGLSTANDLRFVRYHWEINLKNDRNEDIWIPFEKGGGYSRWYGNHYWTIDWENNGIRIKSHPTSYVRNEYYFFKEGYTYSATGSGNVGIRVRIGDDIFSNKASSIILNERNIPSGLAAVVNSRISTYLLRSINSGIDFTESYISRIPVMNSFYMFSEHEMKCIKLKEYLISNNLLEFTFDPVNFLYNYNALQKYLINACLLLVEGEVEKSLTNMYSLDEKEILLIYKELGAPVGIYYRIKEYEKIPTINEKSLSSLIFNYDANTIQLNNLELNQIKEKLEKLYKNYMGVNKNIDYKDEIKYNTMPIESMIENFSQALKIHPISIYWLLKEGIEKEGWYCLIENKQIILDRFTIIILRLFGHLWPKQIKADESILEWADPDGIIPLTRDSIDSTLIDRIRECINEDFEIDSFTIEREFEELLGKSLEKWLLDDFFEHHQSQFRKRPVAWQIQSIPLGSSRRGSKRRIEPAFACLIYCQKVDGDTLHKIRSQYVGPLKNGYEAELRTLETIGLLNTEQTVRQTKLEMLIEELEKFDAKLQGVINEGFDSKELEKFTKDEPLDRWCSVDGEEPPPDSREGLYLQERAYIPDINDGVRVNIAPLQKAGLLASDVLASKDVERAISARAEYRADERRWCREGKLPQPRWWKKEEAE